MVIKLSLVLGVSLAHGYPPVSTSTDHQESYTPHTP